MRLTFYGAAQTVTGSKHLLEIAGKKILLDCGLFQGFKAGAEKYNNRHFGFKPSSIDAVILSHAHIDHSGLLPKLVKDGFKGNIYATPATADLCRLMLLDSAKIQEQDLKFVNRARQAKDLPPIEPLYDIEDAYQALAYFVPVEYHHDYSITDEIRFRFTEAGHILGSAAVNLTLKDGLQTKRLTFTADIGRKGDKILRAPEPFPQADYIICESTYGNREHGPIDDLNERLLEIVRHTCIEKKGKLIIPAFSVDRTQEIIYALDQLESSGVLPVVNVYVDSPLSVEATKVMQQNKSYFNPEILEYIQRDGDAFGFINLHYVSDAQDSKRLNNLEEPCIIISASGMAEAGRVKHHIKHNLGNPRTTILFAGYCSPGTLGYNLKNGDKKVRIFGEEYPVKAEVQSIEGFSAHADFHEIMDYLACQDKQVVKRLFLVHGEFEAQKEFKEKLIHAGFNNIEIPDLGEHFEL